MPDKRIFLVTADHVAKTLGDGGFCIRLNRKADGLGCCHQIEYANWLRHPREAHTTDIAILEIQPPDWCRLNFVPRKAFASDQKMGTKNIGPGDIAYVVGLFEPLYGKRKNLPTVHTGHVALIPADELLPVDDWHVPDPTKAPPIEVEAYLIQVQNTLPGISGAPVFVRRSIKTRLFDKEVDPSSSGIQVWHHGSLWLLGVWTDGWFNHLALRAPNGGKVTIPAGMGAVVPVRKLMDILEGS